MKTVLWFCVLSLGLAACQPTQAAAPPSPTAAATAAPLPSLTPTAAPSLTPLPTATPAPTLPPTPTPHPLTIQAMRQRDYPGSDITIEEVLTPGANYQRLLTSYRSEGLKIYALLTLPNGDRPEQGWPAIVFNHGYIPPREYRTTERYVAYVDALARAGYVVFRPDYRGHGFSEGTASGAYGSPDYTVDVINALTSLQRLPEVDAQRVGMWGHSMGGHITLRAMVTRGDIRAGVIWAGVVASYPDLLNRWRAAPPPSLSSGARRWRDRLADEYGSVEQNPDFWDSISPIHYVADLSGPIQLHHGTADADVPVHFSESLYRAAQAAGQPVEMYLYEGDNHNISINFSTAMGRTVAFFDRYLK